MPHCLVLALQHVGSAPLRQQCAMHQRWLAPLFLTEASGSPQLCTRKQRLNYIQYSTV